MLGRLVDGKIPTINEGGQTASHWALDARSILVCLIFIDARLPWTARRSSNFGGRNKVTIRILQQARLCEVITERHVSAS